MFSLMERFLFLAVLWVFVPSSSTQLNYRLNKDIIPEYYDITIKPYLLDKDASREFTFDGEVNITIYATKSNVNVITLHKNLIEINKASLHGANGINLVQQFDASELSYDNGTHKLSLILRQSLATSGRYTLYLSYNGKIRNDTAGIFRTSYVDAHDETKWIVLTQAQRIDARTIFPCWDEPAFKAKFRMRINRPKDYISIFNTRLISSHVDGLDSDRYWDTFEWTPVMSTYLIAFMVCQYVKRGDQDVVILSRPEYTDYTKFSHEIAKIALDAYGNYTKIPYQRLENSIMQKTSAPQFPHNGMENWGLVLYRDPVLIQEIGFSDGWKNKQYTIMILIHETGHMWFGNSVTFAWWSYFWLNEGFARYYQYFLANKIYPEYQLDQQFVVNQLHSIFNRDALNSTIPLSTSEDLIETPDEIASMFSSIAYAKGASILRMFRNLMGEEPFDEAIHEYLTEFHLKNTRPHDLFKHLKQHWSLEQQVDLDEFFNDWTEKVGFPMLMVNVSSDRKKVLLRQKRFLVSPNDGSDPNLQYTIPITYTTSLENNFQNLAPRMFFNTSMDNVIVDVGQPFDWIIFNIQQSNYYRVFYDTETIGRIQRALEKPFHSNIHVINRAQIIDDLFNFARTGLVNYVDAFKFLEYLVHETDYLPWQAALTSLDMISKRMTLEKQSNFGDFLIEISANIYHKLGFKTKNDTVLDVYNRNNIVYWVCKYKNEDCNKRAQRMLQRVNVTDERISPDIRETIYCSAMRFGEFRNYLILDQWLTKESRNSEKELILRSLGCTLHFTAYHFSRILTDQIPQEYKRLTLKPLYAENPENVVPVLHMILNSYDRLADQLGSFSELADVIKDLCDYVTRKKEQKLLEEFIFEHGVEFGESIEILKNSTKIIESNIGWAAEHLIGLNDYLEGRNRRPSLKHSFLNLL